MPQTKVLLIEDDPDSVATLIELLSRDADVYACRVTSFAEHEEAIDAFVPDVVVLDLLERGPSGDQQVPGKTVFDLIWKSRFRPIVIYSAQPSALDDTRQDHPFVRSVQKGRDSEKLALSEIESMKPQLEAIHGAEKHVRQQFNAVLRNVAPDVFATFPNDPQKRNDMILRAGRRRLAALMDELSEDGQLLTPWEQYLCPPITTNLRLGDILHERGKSNDDPTSFLIVLTPSCDLVTSGGRAAKVKRVLVSRCATIPDGIKSVGLGDINKSKLKRRLEETILRPGYFKTILPLPALRGHVPHMAADLTNLELLPLDQIADAGPYEKVASIDSPFRELVAWAYVQVAARPGLPERDCKLWTDEILTDYPENNGG